MFLLLQIVVQSVVENGQDEHDGEIEENSKVLKCKVGPEIALNIVEFGKLKGKKNSMEKKSTTYKFSKGMIEENSSGKGKNPLPGSNAQADVEAHERSE